MRMKMGHCREKLLPKGGQVQRQALRKYDLLTMHGFGHKCRFLGPWIECVLHMLKAFASIYSIKNKKLAKKTVQ